MNVKPIKWIPASTPPSHTESVLMTGGNYMVCQGVYTPRALSNSPAGFYLRTGAESLVHCTWVEWWIPMPDKPKGAKQ
jgi:hypothetical protein